MQNWLEQMCAGKQIFTYHTLEDEQLDLFMKPVTLVCVKHMQRYAEW